MAKKICVMGANYVRAKKEHQPTLVKLALAIRKQYNALTPLDIARLAHHLQLPCKTSFDWLADAGVISSEVWDGRLTSQDKQTLVRISNYGIEALGHRLFDKLQSSPKLDESNDA